MKLLFYSNWSSCYLCLISGCLIYYNETLIQIFKYNPVIELQHVAERQNTDQFVEWRDHRVYFVYSSFRFILCRIIPFSELVYFFSCFISVANIRTMTLSRVVQCIIVRFIYMHVCWMRSVLYSL